MTYKKGDQVTDDGIKFVSYVDENGNTFPRYFSKSGRGFAQAKFMCNCDEHTEFVAPVHLVRAGTKYCPKCAAKRKEKAAQHSRSARKMNFAPGDIVDPDGLFEFVSEDENATTKKRKIIVREIKSGIVFSALFEHLRAGKIKPRDEKEKNIADRSKKTRKYNIGDIIGKDNNILIVADFPKKNKSSADKNRYCVFKNLNTGFYFDGQLGSVLRGDLTGKFAKKTKEDYPGIL